jgi:hypothetical protein
LRRPFRIVGRIGSIEEIARGREIRELRRLRKAYGGRSWRKMKGVARVRLADVIILKAELQRYEAHGLGRNEYKIKRFIRSG